MQPYIQSHIRLGNSLCTERCADFIVFQNNSSDPGADNSLKSMLRKFLMDKMFLTFLLSSFLLIQAFTSGFAVFPLYAEELGIAKHHVSLLTVFSRHFLGVV